MNRRTAIKTIAALSAMALPLDIFGTTAKRTHFIGLGTASGYIMEFIKKHLSAKFTLVTAPEESSFYKASFGFIPFHSPILKMYGSEKWVVPDMEQEPEIPLELKHVLDKNERFVLLAGLGGYAGTKLIEALVPYLTKENKDFSALCSIPFMFEGKKRRSDALQVAIKFKSLPNFKSFELDMLREKHKNLTIKAAFEKANEEFYGILEREALDGRI